MFPKFEDSTFPEMTEDEPQIERDINETCSRMTEFLIEKNRRYGSSAFEPLRIFASAPSDEQILIRIDDKLSRIKNASELKINDVVDLTGYLLLYITMKEWADKIKEMID